MEVLPTLYEYYTAPAITAGLSADQPQFTLNNKNITLYSGAMHYFRVPKKYWRDRLRKMRAAGLNAVETYVPWNMHEPEDGVFDFGSGGSDFEQLLGIEEFLKVAKEEDLFAIVRPGPYICSEWDFGGMPSWLLRHDGVKLRTANPEFMGFVAKYFKALFRILSVLQFTRGGPIIAFQIENEYGNVKKPDEAIDAGYLQQLKELFVENGLVELYFTSDTPSNGNSGSIPGVLSTANFQNDTVKELDLLKSYQPDRPFMVMEYWTGWFDHWGEVHHTRSTADFSKELQLILAYPSSVNFYMFHGGTNWGFMNGANILDNGSRLSLDTSSYDYDAPLSEAGDYTEKYHAAKELIKKHNTILTRLPDPPKQSQKTTYATQKITHEINFQDLLKAIPTTGSYTNPIAMELLNINHISGQSYGYIVYRKTNLTIPQKSKLKIEGRVCDTVLVLINGELKSKIFNSIDDLNSFGYWNANNSVLPLENDETYTGATLDLIVENFGRNNFGKLDQFDQKKGLWQGGVLLNEERLHDWDTRALEFKRNWTESLEGWKPFVGGKGPALYKTVLSIAEEPKDSFIDMRNWTKGIIIVNGFVLSRYFRVGPQQTAYLPAPFLKKGDNQVLIFEHFKAGDEVRFSDVPVFETVAKF